MVVCIVCFLYVVCVQMIFSLVPSFAFFSGIIAAAFGYVIGYDVNHLLIEHSIIVASHSDAAKSMNAMIQPPLSVKCIEKREENCEEANNPKTDNKQMYNNEQPQ